MPRVSKFTDAQFKTIYLSKLSDEVKAEKLGISTVYMHLKAKKLKIKRKTIVKSEVILNDAIVIVTENGTYSRSYITYEHEAVVKAKELREVIDGNDTEYVPVDFTVARMTEAQIEQEQFSVQKLKRSFGNMNES
jgi:hypothetical protein